MNDLPANPQNPERTDAASDNLPGLSDAFLPARLSISSIGEKFVVFFLNGQPFGIKAGTIAEVSRPMAIAPVPNAPEWLSGIANLRGEVISVVDLPKLLQTDELTPSSKSKFIILHAKDSEALIAFMIEKPGEIIFITTDEIQAATNESARYISGKVPYAGSIMQLINVEKLIDSLTFN